MFKVDGVLTTSVIFDTNGANPLAVASSRYLPGGMSRRWYKPAVLLVVVPCVPVASSVRVIFAPATLAPDGSETLPFNKLVDCAFKRAAKNANRTNNPTN